MLAAGLFVGAVVLLTRGRPEPPPGEPLDFTIELNPEVGKETGDVKDRTVEPTVTEKVNINIATAEEMEALRGIGPVLAGRIVEHRERIGRFKSAYEIIEVNGIGDGKYRIAEKYITVD